MGRGSCSGALCGHVVTVGLWVLAACGAWLLPTVAHALGSCGTGGTRGEREMIPFEGSLYYVTTPDDYDDGSEWPLILGLHGDEGDPASSVNWNWRTVPDGRFIFVAPKASNESGSWYMAGEQNAEWMDALLESLLAQYNVDLDRIYIWGLSGGAEFISGYALDRQDTFAAAQWNMGGNAWGWRSAGSPSPDACKLPARFVVSLDDFLRDGALSLHDELTDAGHETLWLDADCSGHCWDDVESGVGARDWLLDHTHCGMTRPAGCEGAPTTGTETDAPTSDEPSPTQDGVAGGGAPEPAVEPEAPTPAPATPVAPTSQPVPSATPSTAPGSAPTTPEPPATMPLPVADPSTKGAEGSGCAIAPTGADGRPATGAWALLLCLCALVVRSRRTFSPHAAP